MPDRFSRFKAKLLRRSSSPSVSRSSLPAVNHKSRSNTSVVAHDGIDPNSRVYHTLSSLPVAPLSSPGEIAGPVPTADQGPISDHLSQGRSEQPCASDLPDQISTIERVHTLRDSSSTTEIAASPLATPLTLPSPSELPPPPLDQGFSPRNPVNEREDQRRPSLNAVVEDTGIVDRPVAPPKHSSLIARRQLLSHSQGLLDPKLLFDEGRSVGTNPDMQQRKIWVKRPGGSATLVPAMHDAVVDELRDQVILKYGNSLGRNLDSPDILLKITPRSGMSKQATPERVLNPEEPLLSVIDAYYPGGQRVAEALVIDIPPRRTPKASPRHSVYHHHSEQEHDYFTLVPATASHPGVATPPPHPTSNVNSHQAPSISILTSGMAPTLPSPGGRTSRRRPPLTRHTTNSPTVLGQARADPVPAGSPPPLPQSAAPQAMPQMPQMPPGSHDKVMTPPTRGVSPRPARKSKASNELPSRGAAFGGALKGTIPPINVLIVEDNIINQKLLEAFMKRLSVRWKCAANGEEAVRKWRQGGFHLVLMDIQLPVMSGLDATKEIRRLERLNGIGVFPKTADGRSSAPNATPTSPDENRQLRLPLAEGDMLEDLSLFRSPVIIVALTASSLESDRREALAAGCNDFLTKPVGFPWLEQKVTEWGCMQALIDFTGWRKWRGYADNPQLQSGLLPSGIFTSPMQDGEGVGGVGGGGEASPSARKADGDANANGNRGAVRPSAAVIPGEAGEPGNSGSSDDTLDTLGGSPSGGFHTD